MPDAASFLGQSGYIDGLQLGGGFGFFLVGVSSVPIHGR